ncbi:MAG: hypothetical protein Q8R44_19790, partial [Novosphingobium sp.]|nr:hypothetical protein [Novosphingobium sp.]
MREVAPLAINLGTIIAEATGASSNDLAIPNDSSGNKAKRVAISIATAAAYIMLGISTDTVTTTNGFVLNPGDGWVILNCAGSTQTSVIHLQVA